MRAGAGMVLALFVSLASSVLADGPEYRTIIHAPGGDFNQSHEGVTIDYISWDGAYWTAKVVGNTFIHAPGGDFSQSHQDNHIDYLAWGSQHYRATLDGDVLTHAPEYNLSLSHQDTVINYLVWEGAPWTAVMKPEEILGYEDGYSDGVASQAQIIADLQTQVAALQTQVAQNVNLQSQIASLTVQNIQLHDQLTSITSERITLLASNQQLQSDLAEANNSIQTLTAGNQQLQIDLGLANNTIQTLTVKNAELTQASNAVTQQNEALSELFQDQFNNSAFQLPGNTTQAQIQNLVTAIGQLNHGQQQALYKNLGGKKK